MLLKYLNEENKVCPNGEYINDNNECEHCLIQCSSCTKESIKYDSCISCNEGYYQIYNYKNNGSYTKCFKSPERYYLDNNDHYYKECFDSCKSCNKNGNEIYHNCNECRDDYYFEMNFQDSLNCYHNCLNYYYFDKSSNKYYCTENLKCPESYPKLINNDKKCIDYCINEPNNQFEYNNECYNKCPENTTSSSDSTFICDKIKSYTSTTIYEENNYITNKELTTDKYDFFIITEINQNNINDNESYYKEELFINITENYLTNFNNLDNDEIIKNLKKYLIEEFDISELNKGNLTLYKNIDILITLRSLNEQKKFINNETSVDLGNCEKIIKEEYNISEYNALYILKIEIILKGMKIPKTEYEIYYHPFNGTEFIRLNLSNCEGEKIKIFNKVSIIQPLEKYNPKSNYYNDICSKTTSENNTDITLNDRRIEFIKNNMTLCEEKCELIDYDYKEERAECLCKIKTFLPLVNDINFDSEEFKKNFMDINNIANIQILKCYKIIFTKDGIKNNIGCFIFLFIIFIYFICLILFRFKFYDLLKIEINNFICKINSEKLNERKTTKNNNKRQKNKIKINHIRNTNNNNNFSKKNENYPQKKKNKRIIGKRNIKARNKRKKIIKYSKSKLLKDKENKIQYTDFELNDLDYKTAKNNDKRTYCQYYISLLKMNNLFIFSFCPNKDYNSIIIKIFLFFFFFGLHFTINTLFFTDSTIHKIYEDKGIFNISYQIPLIFNSSIISAIVSIIIKFFALSQKNVINLKKSKKSDDKKIDSKKIFDVLNTKFIVYFILSFIFSTFFWHYNTSFCCIYQNTQMHLIKDIIISFGFSLFYPFIKGLIPGIFRISALNSNKNNEILYKISKFLELVF